MSLDILAAILKIVIYEILFEIIGQRDLEEMSLTL